MSKTTLYLPDDLKRALTASARRRSLSEAEVIRQAIATAVAGEDVAPRTGVFTSDVVMADDVETHLMGFGER